MMQSRNNNKKRSRRKASRKSLAVNRDPNLVLRPAFKGQPTYSAVVTSDPTKLTTTVTTGVIAVAIRIGSSLITNFTTRFATFEECRPVKAILKMTCLSSTNPGQIEVYADDDDNTVPTLALAQTHRSKRFAAADVAKTHTMVYIPHDVADLNWQSLASGANINAWFKIFTNNANFAASAVATDYLVYEVDIFWQFRGFA